ncbi:helix-turn-helix domain-containing protein [Georgenia sp. TF02-10]|uniref:IclR family transcriptional regulator n=1 Tax=Georgenia sp. TF02-10 TaxID=2917725 RepID=UPI001FA6DCCD|nr:IclR family transcriptional regulator C-terminal domain-containing protein [Georgenia sp. TF02-10]UNX53715.1 helix-turn-helix domain-containing protein [Georgenia sp. TF02-10]
MADLARTVTEDRPGAREGEGEGALLKALRILEAVADSNGASAKEIAATTHMPLPTVYRLVRLLVDEDYLVHLRSEHRFELGFKVHHLATSLHRQLGVPRAVRAAVARLHIDLNVAAYWTVYRGSDVVVAYIADSPQAPRIRLLDFGLHEGAHGTAFGKIMLAGMTPEQRREYLDAHGMPAMTPTTITSSEELEEHLEKVSRTGIAWEYEEFQPDLVCAAVGARDSAGRIVGSVAISGGTELARRQPEVDRALRAAANRMSRYLSGRGSS